ncbi:MULTISPECIES: hypothetical protein [unclassified Streptomyces]|uniref:hypothetical protein n=1 Tax=unclassified Streptomyces TaxID=2593676 RepID=UPI003328EA2A
MTTPAPTPIDFRTIPPKLTVAATGWQAWWEDYDMWDGFVLYVDLDTAKQHAAIAYMSEEYGWGPEDDPAEAEPREEAPDTTLTWVYESGRWYLLDGDKGTGVQLYRTHTYVAEPTAAEGAGA